MNEKIIMYGNNWCPDCIRTKLIFKKMHVSYDWVNTENDPSARQIVMNINNGNCSVPTILFPDGSILVEPSSKDLEIKLLQISDSSS